VQYLLLQRPASKLKSSVKKVIGAPVTGIIAMLSKDFMKLVCIALLIAFPVSWRMMNA